MRAETRHGEASTRNRWFHRTAMAVTTLIALVIAGLTLAPSVSPPPASLDLSDKAYHAIAFATLVIPASIVFSGHVAWIASAVFLYGAAIEVVQPLVGRDAELADMAANSIGILIGIGIAWGIRTILQARRSVPSGPSDP